MYLFFFKFFSCLGYYRILSRFTEMNIRWEDQLYKGGVFAFGNDDFSFSGSDFLACGPYVVAGQWGGLARVWSWASQTRGIGEPGQVLGLPVPLHSSGWWDCLQGVFLELLSQASLWCAFNDHTRKAWLLGLLPRTTLIMGSQSWKEPPGQIWGRRPSLGWGRPPTWGSSSKTRTCDGEGCLKAPEAVPAFYFCYTN